tara:strand:+ start:4805 stop:4984 length:180 start_codon:yes stop_codon:yes gene_type:complete
MIEYILISYLFMFIVGFHSIVFDWVDWYETFFVVLTVILAPMTFLLAVMGFIKSLWKII